MPSLVSRPTTDLVPSSRRRGAVIGHAVQNVSLAALIGGNLFGQVAMHPALGDIADATERGRVLNHAWRRYGTVNSLALAGLAAGWATTRDDASGPVWRRRGALVRAKDIGVGTVIVTGFAAAAGGVGFAAQAPDGAVPLADGRAPAPQTPRRAARLKRVANGLGRLNLAAELTLLGIDALLVQGA